MPAHYVHDLSPFLVEFGNGFGIRWYGMAYVAAFVCGFFLYRRLARAGYSDLRPDEVGDFITWGAIFGVVVGGRVGYILFYNLHEFLRSPLMIFKLWDGGMSSHGGIIGLTLFTLWYARRHRISWLNIGDNLVVVAPLGLFFGRIANFINGELYGNVTTVPWGMHFPGALTELQHRWPFEADAIVKSARAIDPTVTTVESLQAAIPGSPALKALIAESLPARHPSQLYEAFLEGVVLFGLLWWLRTRVRLPNGVLTGVFFIGYAVLRILGELFRQPDAPLTGFLTRGQFLSLFLILIGAGFLVAAFWRPSWPPRWRGAPLESAPQR
jgi:phosphatidylglycerol:prolipoprotein diacylglycerol transferase